MVRETMRTTKRTFISSALATAIAVSIFTGSATQPAHAAPLTAAEATQLGTEAYIYGYPLVTMEITRRVMTNVAEPEGHHAPMGQFANARTYPDAAFRDVTAPNADTLYSTAWLDVWQGAVRPEPAGRGRPLLPDADARRLDRRLPGSRQADHRRPRPRRTPSPGRAGRARCPTGVKEYKSPTSMVWILGRTYCTGTPEDYKAVHAIQDKYSARAAQRLRQAVHAARRARSIRAST